MSASILCRGFAVTTLVVGLAINSVSAHSAAEEMAEAAGHFLAALGPEQRAKATFEFQDTERSNWHFIPKPRRGLPFKEMTPAQRLLAQGLLNSGLSQRGYLKATTIMSLEQVLHDLENGSGPTRDPEMYYVSIFGAPGPSRTWGWRVEGHHLSVNFTIREGKGISTTPSFFGSNPAEVREGPRRGLRVLADEEDLAYGLMRSLNDDQRRMAVIATDAPREIITGNSRQAAIGAPVGLPATRLSASQNRQVRELIQVYVERYRPDVAELDLRKIRKAGFDKVWFAWAGGLERGQGHYYRIQGPTFLMEFDNTQNNANHIHTVWRDFAGDFGEDLLREHYEQYPHAK